MYLFILTNIIYFINFYYSILYFSINTDTHDFNKIYQK